jgi:hypothetical protein
MREALGACLRATCASTRFAVRASTHPTGCLRATCARDDTWCVRARTLRVACGRRASDTIRGACGHVPYGLVAGNVRPRRHVVRASTHPTDCLRATCARDDMWCVLARTLRIACGQRIPETARGACEHAPYGWLRVACPRHDTWCVRARTPRIACGQRAPDIIRGACLASSVPSRVRACTHHPLPKQETGQAGRDGANPARSVDCASGPAGGIGRPSCQGNL